MKNSFLIKYLSVLIVSILITSLSLQAFAIGDWGTMYKDYDESEYEKIISGQDFNNAIKTMEKYSKKGKKSGKKSNAIDVNDNKYKIILDMPSKGSPLLTLPVNVSYNEKMIKQGFYLAKAINKDDQYFIRLTEGENKIIADIEANVFKTENLAKIADENKKAFYEFLEDDILKITYSDKNCILEAYLWIQ